MEWKSWCRLKNKKNHKKGPWCTKAVLLKCFWYRYSSFIERKSRFLRLFSFHGALQYMLLPIIFKIGMQKMTLESDKRLAEMEMKAKLGQLIYLESLTKVSTESIQIQILTIGSSSVCWGIRFSKLDFLEKNLLREMVVTWNITILSHFREAKNQVFMNSGEN